MPTGVVRCWKEEVGCQRLTNEGWQAEREERTKTKLRRLPRMTYNEKREGTALISSKCFKVVAGWTQMGMT